MSVLKQHKMSSSIKNIQFLLLTTFIVFQVNSILGQTSLKAIGLKSGKHHVGFKHYQTVDSTRTYKRIFDWSNKSMFRPIPIIIWYSSSIQHKSLETMMGLVYM